jgi:2-iminobutanoate/2-iminopropanoate deaminase
MAPFKLWLTALAIVISATSLNASGQERTFINPSSATSTAGSPFSGGVNVNGTVYLSGRLGLENGVVPADPAQEARNVLNIIKNTLESGGLTMDDLVYVQIFCSDLSLYEVFNEVYRTYFSAEFPARAFIGTGSLLNNAHFEIQAIAVAR